MIIRGLNALIDHGRLLMQRLPKQQPTIPPDHRLFYFYYNGDHEEAVDVTNPRDYRAMRRFLANWNCPRLYLIKDEDVKRAKEQAKA